MKSEKGITLISLIFYVVSITIIVGVVAMITAFFYTNTESMNESSNAVGTFNFFNLEMVKETKKDGNKIVSISQNEDKVIFSSGTVFTFQDNGIYNDKTKICTGIDECAFRKVMQEEKEILRVFIRIGDFAKTMEYVVGGAEGNNNSNTNTEESYTNASEKEYVQSGLKLRYSAENNTGTGHSNTTTTWRDLSSNHNDAIINNATWGENYIEFNGNNSWINLRKTKYQYSNYSGSFHAK